MKQLRVLSLSNYSITKLSKSIENLISLRYLNLSHTGIEMLPPETCKLYNLQTLLLSGCSSLTELPKDMGKLVNLRHLDITDTGLSEMPVQIVGLQNIQTLSDFIVSEQCDGLKVAELGKFPHLQGKLSISELQNITKPSDAFQANLKMKKNIDELILKWNWYGTTLPDSQIQSHVLEQLRPSTNLKNLAIDGYGGTSFPTWLGDSSFANMVSLHIDHCNHCLWLPPLGQLHNLKELHIYEMKSIKMVGDEFYGSSSYPSFQPFPSLETLVFREMPEWEEWKLIGSTASEFPTLRHLHLGQCLKLKGNIPKNLPSLTDLGICDCPLLVSGNLNHNSNVIRPSDAFTQLMFPLNSLRKLMIKGFPSLTSFPRDSLHKTLQSLTFSDCENLEFLPRESLQNYTSLEDLKISNSCSSMTSFTLGSLPVLKSLDLCDCKNLNSIFIAEDASQSLSFLKSIKILGCDELESISPSGLPTPNLIDLQISSCEKLHSLPEPINTFPNLQELIISYLPNLKSFAKEGLPINLRELTVVNIGLILWNTVIIEWSLERITCLSVLRIWRDDIVKALMKMEVPLLPTSLVSLHISFLDDIECLDGKWLQHLTSLQNLNIHGARKLKSLPEEGLPCSLCLLHISNCPLLEASWQKKRGKEWHKIAHIPSIVINDKMIT